MIWQECKKLDKNHVNIKIIYMDFSYNAHTYEMSL